MKVTVNAALPPVADQFNDFIFPAEKFFHCSARNVN
jgi:hypothetical protein